MKSIAEIFSSYEELDSEGRHINGTDKHGPNHQYGHTYEELFQEYLGNGQWWTTRENITLMMEIGVADGSSLLAWSEIFPNAWCVGMDIHPSQKLFSKENIEFHLGDQRSKEDCERIANGRLFDVIVEDATHILENTLLTFLYLWPFVKPGGLYIVEEFANIGALRGNIKSMWPNVEIIGTCGPNGQDEPLVVFRKSL